MYVKIITTLNLNLHSVVVDSTCVTDQTIRIEWGERGEGREVHVYMGREHCVCNHNYTYYL